MAGHLGHSQTIFSFAIRRPVVQTRESHKTTAAGGEMAPREGPFAPISGKAHKGPPRLPRGKKPPLQGGCGGGGLKEKRKVGKRQKE
jgi:hypothetical protein